MFFISRLAFLHSDFIDVCTVVIRNIKNMHAVLTSQIADTLHNNDNRNIITDTVKKIFQRITDCVLRRQEK